MKMSRHPNVVEYIGCYMTEDEVWVCKLLSLLGSWFIHLS